MGSALTATFDTGRTAGEHRRRLPVLWRDPRAVEPEELRAIILALQEACQAHPQSADLRTCLGMAYAMNYDAYRSMDALIEARNLEPGNFWAQMKYAELQYRLRALPAAEAETLRALDLARNARQTAVAREQLREIRRLRREGTQKPEWSKPLGPAALWCAAAAAALIVAVAALP